MTINEDRQQKPNARHADIIAELDALLEPKPAQDAPIAVPAAETTELPDDLLPELERVLDEAEATPADTALMLDLLGSLDLSGMDLDSGAIVNATAADPHPKLEQLVGLKTRWEARQRAYAEQRADERRAARAAEERELYRLAREAEGKTVGSYQKHDHDPQKPHETVADFARRLDRERKAIYRGTSAEKIETRRAARPKSEEQRREAKAKAERERRAALTPEQKAKEAERKRLERARKRAAKEANPK